MPFFKRFALSALIIMLTAVSAGCSFKADGARTIEEISGTYSLMEFYETKEDAETDLLDTFDYFYMVVGERSSVTVVYKDADSEEHFTKTVHYTCNYESGSTEMVTELKLRFDMPKSTLDGGVVVNYLTVKDEKLVCQKIGYIPSSSSSMPATMHIVFMSFTQVSEDATLAYVEGKTGLDLE